MIQELVRRLSKIEQRLDGLRQPERPRWIDWTPTVTQNVAVNITITTARYMILGDLVVMHARLEVDSAGTANNNIVIGGQPTIMQAATNSMLIGCFWIQDSGGPTLYVGGIHTQGATDWRFVAHNETNWVGQSPNFALANGDYIWLQGAYERA